MNASDELKDAIRAAVLVARSTGGLTPESIATDVQATLRALGFQAWVAKK